VNAPTAWNALRSSVAHTPNLRAMSAWPPLGHHAAAFANPDRMAVLATLHGLAAKPARSATVLEIGCGDGANVISLAALYPAARFVGLDGSVAAIEKARALTAELGILNLELEVVDEGALPSPSARLESADYIIALDVCSHLDAANRGAFFDAVARTLAPGGTALIGFDTLPGATDFEPLRALMRFHTKSVADPASAVRQARAIVHWHIERIANLHGEGRVPVLRVLAAELERMPDAQLFRILREETYAPLTLVDFSRELEAVGLSWLTNARLDEPRSGDLPEPLRELARGGEAVRRQQYLDYFLMTRRRTSIVCRADEPITREVSPDVFRAFSIGGRVARRHILGVGKGPEPLVVTSSVGETILSDSATLLLTLLSKHVPSAVPVEQLVAHVAPQISAEAALIAIAELWRADVVELALCPPAVAHEASAAPRTGALQRTLAAGLLEDSVEQANVPSLWHREWPLDGAEIAALATMDGTIASAHFDPETLRKLVHKGFLSP